MQDFAEKKKEEKKILLEIEKKHPSLARRGLAMSEGPMLIDETLSLDARARLQNRKSVGIELAEIKRLQQLLRKYRRRRAQKKGRRFEKKD